MGHALLCEHRLACLAVVKSGNWNTPGSLAGDISFAGILDEILQPMLCGLWYKTDVFDCGAIDISDIGEQLLDDQSF